ncbi:hypothetical protein [Neomesorhizobium albiziae]|uniref:hypothetical protein n=1 Tax=Neomesorhizobium albiziae TaxID=335020 RepID=UPI00122CF2A7|nr:hypothetical protein [Mesorhizobium albiziae]GLS28339.1 hypothetical protein GCM10007937_00460 [Mesorhizobium albiziae]
MITLAGSALFDQDGGPAVWAIDANSAVRLKPITIACYETDRVIISSGLESGDVVVTADVNRPHDKQKVRVDEGDKK